MNHTDPKTSMRVMAPFRGMIHCIGTVSYTAGHGYRFMPVYQAGPSRRFWPSPEAALAGRVPAPYTLEPHAPKTESAPASASAVAIELVAALRKIAELDSGGDDGIDDAERMRNIAIKAIARAAALAAPNPSVALAMVQA